MERPEKRPRGRPREYDAERALASATEAFWLGGYTATSLDDLAASTGMNRPSLYAAFGDKRSLYLKTLDRYREQVRAEAIGLIADDPPLRIFLQRFYWAALDLYLGGSDARGCYTIGTAATEATVDPQVRAFVAESIRNTDGFLAVRIRRAQDRREGVSDAEPEALARIATATLHTLSVRSRAGFSRAELDGLVSETIDIICGRPASRARAK